MSTDAQTRSNAKAPPWWLLGAVCALATLLIAAFGCVVRSGAAFVVVLMAGVTALAAGILLGFLFGIPRTPNGDENGSSADRKEGGRGLDYRPSTNLEQVTDWLTKILVGVGLVELKQVGNALGRLGTLVSAALNPPLQGVNVLAECAVIVFACVGFLLSFLWTRVHYAAIQVGTDIGILEQLHGLQRDVHVVAQLATSPSEIEPTKLIETPSDSTKPEAEVFRKIAEFERAPAVFESDPTAEIFPGYPSFTQSRRLTGRIDKKMQGALILVVRVEAIGGERLEGEAIFLLHPTMDDPVRRVTCNNNAAETKFFSEGTFHVVAVVDSGKTVLALDLSEVPAVPKWFVDA